MKNYSIDPGKTKIVKVAGGFYLANTMLSIKVLGIPGTPSPSIGFQITFKDGVGHEYSFPMTLFPPYYYDATTFNAFEPINGPKPGPYNRVEIKSRDSNPAVVIQFGFTSRLVKSKNI